MTRLAAIAVAFFAWGCATPSKEPPPKPFAATKWQLIMDIPAAGEQPHVRFGDGRMEGFGGCSKFAARYVQDSVGARAIVIGRIEVDRRLCDVSAREAESRMLEVLQAVSSYSITSDLMTMSGSGGSLRFRSDPPAWVGASAAAAEPAAPLTGTRWKGVVEAGVDPAAVPWLEFTPGRVSGYTGCNMMSGTWRMEGTEVRMGPLVTTKRGCGGVASEIERRVTSALNPSARVSRDGQRLVFSAPGADRFEFSEVK